MVAEKRKIERESERLYCSRKGFHANSSKKSEKTETVQEVITQGRCSADRKVREGVKSHYSRKTLHANSS